MIDLSFFLELVSISWNSMFTYIIPFTHSYKRTCFVSTSTYLPLLSAARQVSGVLPYPHPYLGMYYQCMPSSAHRFWLAVGVCCWVLTDRLRPAREGTSQTETLTMEENQEPDPTDAFTAGFTADWSAQHNEIKKFDDLLPAHCCGWPNYSGTELPQCKLLLMGYNFQQYCCTSRCRRDYWGSLSRFLAEGTDCHWQLVEALEMPAESKLQKVEDSLEEEGSLQWIVDDEPTSNAGAREIHCWVVHWRPSVVPWALTPNSLIFVCDNYALNQFWYLWTSNMYSLIFVQDDEGVNLFFFVESPHFYAQFTLNTFSKLVKWYRNLKQFTKIGGEFWDHKIKNWIRLAQ